MTSASPEWDAESGSAPHAAASTATMPNASGNVLGTTCGDARRQQVGQVVVLEPAGEVDAVERAGGGFRR